jgi:hypothetical protein
VEVATIYTNVGSRNFPAFLARPLEVPVQGQDKEGHVSYIESWVWAALSTRSLMDVSPVDGKQKSEATKSVVPGGRHEAGLFLQLLHFTSWMPVGNFSESQFPCL